MKISINFKILALLLAFTMGCSNSDLDRINPNQVTTESFYANAAQLTAAVNAVYAIVQSNSLVAREYFFLHDLRSDDVASGGGQLETPRNQLLLGVHDAGNFVVSQVWPALYRTIHRANGVIQNADRATDATEGLRRRLVGEARFLRAWAYFELVTLWGGVPINTEVITSTAQTSGRASADDVYNLIIADLTAIQADLPASYTGADVGRVTRGAAQALLGKAYLQRGQYTQAKAEFDKVISSGTYRLEDNYLDNFLEETEWNAESIFEIGFSKIGDVQWNGDGDGIGNETSTRSQEYLAIGWRNLIPSDVLLEAFEKESQGDLKTDPRYAMSFYEIGDLYFNNTLTLTDNLVQGNSSTIHGDTRKVSWRKYSAMYKNAGSYYTSGINHRIIRYADVLLMAAECELELNNLTAAVNLINQVRARPSVAMPALPTARFPVTTQAQVRTALIHERQVELAGEQVRNRDIMRWRALGKLTSEPISYFQPRHALLPIPLQEIDNNDRINNADQNPGY
jgi:tetratricopeptide (TPR) repeat protein